jgi:hypothetical protein
MTKYHAWHIHFLISMHFNWDSSAIVVYRYHAGFTKLAKQWHW